MSNWSEWRRTVDLDGYDARWEAMAATGENPHGEADLVCRFSPSTVLDAGCGTGRVGIELARRGIDVVGTDLDPDLLSRARVKASQLEWVLTNLADLSLGRVFDVVIMAGNVIPFVDPSDRANAVAGAARHVAPDGVLIAGFSLRHDWPSLPDYDSWCSRAGLSLRDRFASWNGDAFIGGDYAVSVHGHSPS